MNEAIPEHLTVETDSIAVRRRRPISGMVGMGAIALFLLPLFVMMVGGAVFGMDKPSGWAAIVSGSWIGGMFAAALAGAFRAGEIPRRGMIEIASGRLTLVHGARRETLPEGAVLGGSVTPRVGGALLTLSLADGRTASAFVPSEAAGARALEALRIDPMGQALVERFQGGLARSAAGFGVVFALVMLGGWLKQAAGLGFASGLGWTAASLALLAIWLYGTREPEIAVGADGVRIRGKAGVRFIPFVRIRSVNVDTWNTLVLDLEDGTADRTRVALGNAPMLAAVAHRIELAKKAARGAGDAPTLLSVIGRGARTFAAWREDLRVRIKRADYRTASLDGGELEQLIGSSGASAEHRIGAALALRESRGVHARSRIRIAAAQCVDPRVRVALETIASDEAAEERAVEEALAASEAPAVARAAP